MKQKKCKDALITAYRIDNQELKRKLAEAKETYARCWSKAYQENISLLVSTVRAERTLDHLIEVGDVLLNQDGMDNDKVTAAENEWRKLVDEWRQR